MISANNLAKAFIPIETSYSVFSSPVVSSVSQAIGPRRSLALTTPASTTSELAMLPPQSHLNAVPLPTNFGRRPICSVACSRAISTATATSVSLLGPTHRSEPPALHSTFSVLLPMTETPNYVLQRAAAHVTSAASTSALLPATQPPRRAPRSLSSGSLGASESHP